MMIAVVLSSNIKKMIKDNVLVRKPVGIEAAGSMNILFTDKTGTVTEGKMSVSEIISAENTMFKDFQSFKKGAPRSAELYLLNSYFNTSSSFSDNAVIGGNATEKALGDSVLSSLSHSKIDTYTVLERIPFDSAVKYSAVNIVNKDSLVLIKGAPERLLPHCKYAYSDDGKKIPFASVSKELLSCTSKLTREGKRLLWIAESSNMPKAHQGELTFICAVVLLDKIREEAKASNEALRQAGVGVVMITGDNKDTAEHIARECGIINSQRTLVLESSELSSMSDNELKSKLPFLAVVARALPQDKSRLVKISQESGLVVGMTGDGINDAPSLKLADVGFAMGSGADIAKSAGDVVIVDNSFFAINRTILYGRTIFKSIRKFITFQLIMNLAACGITLLGQLIGVDNPITIIQMLWVNIIMDTLGGLAFAGEAPLSHYMKEKPKRRDEPILSRETVSQVLLNGGFTLALLICFLTLPLFRDAYSTAAHHLTAFYALFIFAGLFNSFAARCDRFFILSDIGKNKPFILIMLAIAVAPITRI